MKITITLLDIDNRDSTGAIPYLPAAHSFDSVNEACIRGISIGPFYSEQERDELFNKFPKSYKGRKSRGYADKADGRIDFDKRTYYVYFEFRTFWPNGVTGEKNEAAIARKRTDQVLPMQRYRQTKTF